MHITDKQLKIKNESDVEAIMKKLSVLLVIALLLSSVVFA